jgi:hypothetical protein
MLHLMMLLLVIEHIRCCMCLIRLLLRAGKCRLMTATPLPLRVMMLNNLMMIVTLMVLLRKWRDSSDLANSLFEGFNGGFPGSLVLSPVEVHDFGLLLANQVIL